MRGKSKIKIMYLQKIKSYIIATFRAFAARQSNQAVTATWANEFNRANMFMADFTY